MGGGADGGEMMWYVSSVGSVGGCGLDGLGHDCRRMVGWDGVIERVYGLQQWWEE